VFQKLGMRHLPVCDNKGEVVGILTRKNLMHYLLTDQKETELMKIRRVQRGARKYLKYRKLKANKLFQQFATSDQEHMTFEEMEKAMSHHMETNLGLTWDDEEHSFTHIIEHVKNHHQKTNISSSHVTQQNFDNLLAEARRFDGKKRREKSEKEGIDIVAETQKKMASIGRTSSLQKELDKTRGIKKRASVAMHDLSSTFHTATASDNEQHLESKESNLKR
jgi:hypothetical protein